MKRFSLLVAILLIVTIGGVYATWIYPSDSATFDSSVKYSYILASDDHEGNYGSFVANHNVGEIKIDQKDTNTASIDYTAVLASTYTDGTTVPKITFTFTPTTGASEEIKTNGIMAYAYLSLTSGSMPQYDGEDDDATAEDVFTLKFTNTANGCIKIYPVDETVPEAEATAGRGFKWTKSGASFTCTITLEEIDDLISLNDTFVLDSHDKYLAFSDALATDTGKSFKLTITNVAPTN